MLLFALILSACSAGRASEGRTFVLKSERPLRSLVELDYPSPPAEKKITLTRKNIPNNLPVFQIFPQSSSAPENISPGTRFLPFTLMESLFILNALQKDQLTERGLPGNVTPDRRPLVDEFIQFGRAVGGRIYIPDEPLAIGSAIEIISAIWLLKNYFTDPTFGVWVGLRYHYREKKLPLAKMRTGEIDILVVNADFYPEAAAEVKASYSKKKAEKSGIQTGRFLDAANDHLGGCEKVYSGVVAAIPAAAPFPNAF